MVKSRLGDLPMLTKVEIQSLGPTELAVLCGKVAESPSATALEADQAREMKGEWASLNVSAPRPNLKEQQAIEAKMERLRQKMITFLAAVLPAH
jgi:hypothetical protein